MLLLPRGSGKVGRCRVTKRSLLVKASRLSYFVAQCSVQKKVGGLYPWATIAIRRYLAHGTSELCMDLYRVTTKAS